LATTPKPEARGQTEGYAEVEGCAEIEGSKEEIERARSIFGFGPATNA
jgi:hypothetical protein